MTLQQRIGESNERNGWHARYHGLIDEEAKRDHITAKLALVISEVVEAIEEVRSEDFDTLTEVDYREVIFSAVDASPQDKPDGFPVEIADAVIRLYDLAHMLGIDLDAVIEEKLDFNQHRGVRHGGKHL